MKKFIKHICVLLFVVIAALNSIAIESNYKNNLLNVELAQTPDNHVSVLLVFAQPYKDKIKVVYKSDNEYNILLPETYHSVTSISTVKALNVRSATAKLVPYFNQGNSNGYTKIILKTTRPVVFNAHASYVTNTQIAQNNKLLEKLNTSEAKTTQNKTVQTKTTTPQTQQKQAQTTKQTKQKVTVEIPKDTTPQLRKITATTLPTVPTQPSVNKPQATAKTTTQPVANKPAQTTVTKPNPPKGTPIAKKPAPKTKNAVQTKKQPSKQVKARPAQKTTQKAPAKKPATQPTAKKPVTQPTTAKPVQPQAKPAPVQPKPVEQKPVETKPAEQTPPAIQTEPPLQPPIPKAEPKAPEPVQAPIAVPSSQPVQEQSLTDKFLGGNSDTTTALAVMVVGIIALFGVIISILKKKTAKYKRQYNSNLDTDTTTVTDIPNDMKNKSWQEKFRMMKEREEAASTIQAEQEQAEISAQIDSIYNADEPVSEIEQEIEQEAEQPNVQFSQTANRILQPSEPYKEIPVEDEYYEEPIEYSSPSETFDELQRLITEEQTASSLDSYAKEEPKEDYNSEFATVYKDTGFDEELQEESAFEENNIDIQSYEEELEQPTVDNIEYEQELVAELAEEPQLEPQITSQEELQIEPEAEQDFTYEEPMLNLDEPSVTNEEPLYNEHIEPTINIGAQSNVKVKASSNPVSDPFNLKAPQVEEGFAMSIEDELRLNEQREELNDISDLEPVVDSVYEQAPDTENLEVDVQINEPDALKPVEPVLLNQAKISKTKGFYLIRYEKETALVGYIKDKIFLIQSFSDTDQTYVQTRLTEKKKGQEIYLVRSENYKALVEVTKDEMKNIITL